MFRRRTLYPAELQARVQIALYRIRAALSTAGACKKSEKFREIPCNRKNNSIYYLGYCGTFISDTPAAGRKERQTMQNNKLRNVAIIAHVDHYACRRDAQAGRRLPWKSGGRGSRDGLQRPWAWARHYHPCEEHSTKYIVNYLHISLNFSMFKLMLWIDILPF